MLKVSVVHSILDMEPLVRSSKCLVAMQNDSTEGKQTENLKCIQKYAHIDSIILCIPHLNPFFDFINIIIVNHYLSQ